MTDIERDACILAAISFAMGIFFRHTTPDFLALLAKGIFAAWHRGKPSARRRRKKRTTRNTRSK